MRYPLVLVLVVLFRRRKFIYIHPQIKTHPLQDLLYLVQGFPAEVLGLKDLLFRFLD
jgi:hypothetical protein